MVVACMDRQRELCLVNCSILYPFQPDHLVFVGHFFTCPAWAESVCCPVSISKPSRQLGSARLMGSRQKIVVLRFKQSSDKCKLISDRVSRLIEPKRADRANKSESERSEKTGSSREAATWTLVQCADSLAAFSQPAACTSYPAYRLELKRAQLSLLAHLLVPNLNRLETLSNNVNKGR